MQVTHRLTRRRFFGTAALAATPLLASAGSAAVASSLGQASTSTDDVQLLLPGDQAYSIAMQAGFPEVLSDLETAHLQTLSCLAVSKTYKPIRALALRWSVTTSKGTHQEVVMHHTPAWLPTHQTNAKSNGVGVARRALVRPYKTVLLTPYTSLSAASYGRGYRPSLNTITSSSVRNGFYKALASKTTADSVTVSVAGILYQDRTVSGELGATLYHHVLTLHNAEHDQALSLLRTVAKHPVSALIPKLSSRRYTPLTPTATPAKRAYQLARKQQAQRFSGVLATVGSATLVAHLKRLTKYPKVAPLPKT